MVLILVLFAALFSPACPLPEARILFLPGVIALGGGLVFIFSPLAAVGRLELGEIISAALLLAAFLLLRPPDSARRLFALSAIFLGVGLVFYGVGRTGAGFIAGPPLAGTYVNRNHFCALLGLILPLAASFGFASRPPGMARICRVGVLFLSAGILLTKSRGGALAAALSLAAVFVLFLFGSSAPPREKKRRLVSGLLVGLLLAAAGAVLYLRSSPPEVYSTSLEALSIRIRYSIWQSTARIFLARPLAGWGWGSFRYLYPGFREASVWYAVPHAHNEYLQLLAEGGVIGFALLVFAFGWSLLRLLKIYLSSPRSVSGLFALGAAGSLLYAAVHSGFDFILRLPANTVFLTSLIGLGLAGGPGLRRPAVIGRALKSAIIMAMILLLVLFFLLPLFRFHRSSSLFLAGERLLAAGRPKEARELFFRSRKLDPAANRPLLGSAAAGMALFDRAEEKVGLYSSIIRDLEAARRNNPWDPRPLQSLGRFHQRLSAYSEAAGYLEAARILDPASPFPYYELARNDLLRGDYRSGARRLSRAISLYPSIWDAARGLLLEHTRDYDYLKELPPPTGEFHRRWGYQLLAEKNPEGAEAEFKQAVALAPDDPENWRALGLLYSRLGRWEEAERSYRSALLPAPDRPDLLGELGDVFLKSGALEAARDCYLRAYNLAPAHKGYPGKAAGTIRRLEGEAAAIVFWEAVTEKNPGWDRPYYRRAVLSLKTGDLARAEEELEAALGLSPRNSTYLNLKQRLGRYRHHPLENSR